MVEGHKIVMKPEISIRPLVLLKKDSDKEGSGQKSPIIKWASLSRILLPGEARRRCSHTEASFPLSLTLELHIQLSDSVVTWTEPYKEPPTDQQRAAWLVNGSSKVNRQHPVQKATV